MKARYNGRADTLSFRKSDFTRHGVDDQGAVTFAGEGDVQDISDAAFEMLVSHEFPITKDEDESEDGATEPVADGVGEGEDTGLTGNAEAAPSATTPARRSRRPA